MHKYYLMEIETLIQTFTVLDTGKEILFSYSSQENEEELAAWNGRALFWGTIQNR